MCNFPLTRTVLYADSCNRQIKVSKPNSATVEGTERSPAAGVGDAEYSRHVQTRSIEIKSQTKRDAIHCKLSDRSQGNCSKKMLWAPALGSPSKQVKCQSLSIYKYTRAQSERILWSNSKTDNHDSDITNVWSLKGQGKQKINWGGGGSERRYIYFNGKEQKIFWFCRFPGNAHLSYWCRYVGKWRMCLQADVVVNRKENLSRGFAVCDRNSDVSWGLHMKYEVQSGIFVKLSISYRA